MGLIVMSFCPPPNCKKMDQYRLAILHCCLAYFLKLCLWCHTTKLSSARLQRTIAQILSPPTAFLRSFRIGQVHITMEKMCLKNRVNLMTFNFYRVEIHLMTFYQRRIKLNAIWGWLKNFFIFDMTL